MSETETFEDTMEKGARLLEAGRVFSRASVRAFQLLGSISNVRQTIKKTVPFGQEALELENIDSVLAILADAKLSKILTIPAQCAFVRRAKKPLSALLLDVDLTHPFLLPNDLDLIA
jgi:hypothetical protein